MDTSIAAAPTSPHASRRPVPRWRLGRNLRRAVLVVHIVSAGAWIGIEVVLGTLVLTAAVTDSGQTAGLAFP